MLRSGEPFGGAEGAPETPFSVIFVSFVVKALPFVEGEPRDLLHSNHPELLHERQ